ncbi:MAG: hypothetical protein ACRDN6_13070 [Gaiellaceae bacterium]
MEASPVLWFELAEDGENRRLGVVWWFEHPEGRHCRECGRRLARE